MIATRSPAFKAKPPFLLPHPGAGCVLWLPGQDDPQSATIRDRSGNGNNGTISGALWRRLSSGLWDLDFDALDDLVSCGDGASIQNIWDGGGTVLLWAYPKSGGEGDIGRMCCKVGVGGTPGWSFDYTALALGKVKLELYHKFSVGGALWVSTATALTVNKWAMVACVYNADDVANNPVIYFFDVDNPTGATPALTESQTPIGARLSDVGVNFEVGGWSNGDGVCDGPLAIPRAFTSELTLGQCAGIFNQERHLFNV